MKTKFLWLGIVSAIAIGAAAIALLELTAPSLPPAAKVRPTPTIARRSAMGDANEAMLVTVSLAASTAVASGTTVAAAAAPPAPPTMPRPKPEVPIPDGKTIDFSTGAAVIKDNADDQAALERSLREMDAAAGAVTFPAKK